MINRKRIAALFLIMCMGTSALAGCGNNASSESSEASEISTEAESSKEGTETAIDEEPIEITWLGYYTSNITISENTWAEQLLEEAANVKINAVTDVNAENASTFIASGDILDVTCFSSYLYGDTGDLYSQGLIREFPEEWLWEYYPTGMQYLVDLLGEEFFEEGGHLYEGKALYTPYASTYNDNTMTIMYRNDWMEKVGMSEPKTLDELHDLLYAFTYNDPDGNGIDDTYGICPIYSWGGLWPVYGAFGFVNTMWNGKFELQEDGSVTYTTVSEKYKDALTVIKKWYDEGIIDPECITADRGRVRTKWTEGKTGVMCEPESWLLSYRGQSGVIGMLESIAGEGIISVMNPLTSEYGDGTIYAPITEQNSTKAVYSMYFTANATDEQVIAVLKVLEAMASDTELLKKIIYGEEGTDYTMSEDGSLAVSSTVNVEYQASKGLDTYFGIAVREPEFAKITLNARDKANYDIISQWPTIANNTSLTNYTNEAYNAYYAEVTKIEGEYYSNVLLGNADLEDDWDSYVAKMYAAGLDKIIDEYEELVK